VGEGGRDHRFLVTGCPNATPQLEFEIPGDAWRVKMGWSGNGRFDCSTGHLWSKFGGHFGLYDELTAANIEFELSPAVAALLPVESEAAPVALSKAPVPITQEPKPVVTAQELSDWVRSQIREGKTQSEVERGFRNAFPGKIVRKDRQHVRDLYRSEFRLHTGDELRPGVRRAG
jgi:hypothetical protein